MTNSNRLFGNISRNYMATAQSTTFWLLRMLQSFCYFASPKYLSIANRQIISTLEIFYIFGYCTQKNCMTTSNRLFGNISTIQRLRCSRGSVLAFGTQVRGFKPGRSRRIFRGEKILSTPSFGKEVKPWVACRRFAACKRSLNVPWKSCIQAKLLSAMFLAQVVPPFAARVSRVVTDVQALRGEGRNV